MSIFGKTKGTELEKKTSLLSQGEAQGGAMYYALAKIAKEQFGLDEVSNVLIEIGNQETNHGAFYASLNGKFPIDEENFWKIIKGLSKAEERGEEKIGDYAKSLRDLGEEEAALQVEKFALEEANHGKITKELFDKYAPSYLKEKKENKVYVCKVCGYEYEGDLGQEADDYKCPICGMTKEMFEEK